MKECPILIVEDDLVTARLIELKLKSMGVVPVMSYDGDDASQKLKRIKFKLVLLDLLIPKKDGYELIKEIRANKDISSTKIWVMTNIGREEAMNKVMELGADEFFVKSNVNFADILNRISRACMNGDFSEKTLGRKRSGKKKAAR